jgi:hypothetical protein
MANTPHRIKIKLGDAEFEAEGAEATVQAQYEQFLSTFERIGQKSVPPQVTNSTLEKPPAGALDDALLGRIFDVRQDGVVALKVLPKGDGKEADAFLLILYGYRRLKQEEDVLGTHLLRAAEYSGLTAYRPAQALAAHERYVIRGGHKKGSTYSLNNQGVTKAEEIATKIFE